MFPLFWCACRGWFCRGELQLTKLYHKFWLPKRRVLYGGLLCLAPLRWGEPHGPDHVTVTGAAVQCSDPPTLPASAPILLVGSVLGH